jgi:prepilin peptidase CpaA
MINQLFSISGAGLAVATAALVAAAYHDVRTYQIPNRFAVAIGCGFVAASLGGSWREALFGLALGIAVLVAGTALFARGWLGGGDVKLLAAVILWVPAPLLASFALVTSLAGAALGLLFMTPLRRHLPAAPQALAFATGGAARGTRLRQPMPFGVAIAAGGLFALFARVTV